MSEVKEVTGEIVDGTGEEILDDPTPQPDPKIPLETDEEVEEVEETPEETPEEEEEEELEEEPEPEVKLSPRDEDIVKKLNEKDKTILKEFPQIRSALFEQKEFRKLGTVDDAKEAFERSEILDDFEDIVVAGDAGTFIEQVAANNAEGFEKFSSNFLPALFSKNPQLYDKVVTPLARNMLNEALKQAKASNNINLERSVKHLSQFLFNSPEVPKGQETQEDPKLQAERQKFNNERRDNFRVTTQQNAITVMTSKIERLVPKEVTGALRKVVVDSVLKGIGSQLNKDEYYRRQVDSLYRKADKSNYAGDWGPRIQGVYLGHAIKLLPAVLGLVSKELLGNSARIVKPKPKVKVEAQDQPSPAAKDVFRPDPKTGKKLTDLEFLAS